MKNEDFCYIGQNPNTIAKIVVQTSVDGVYCESQSLTEFTLKDLTVRHIKQFLSEGFQFEAAKGKMVVMLQSTIYNISYPIAEYELKEDGAHLTVNHFDDIIYANDVVDFMCGKPTCTCILVLNYDIDEQTLSIYITETDTEDDKILLDKFECSYVWYKTMADNINNQLQNIGTKYINSAINSGEHRIKLIVDSINGKDHKYTKPGTYALAISTGSGNVVAELSLLKDFLR